MDPIPVPAPPRSAYNPQRRASDLILSQLKHFQHIELKRGDLGIDPAIARDIYTEGGAARYIAAVTNALRGTTAAAATPPPNLAVMPTPSPAKKQPATVAALAAAAAAPKKASAKSASKKSAKPSKRKP